jgi:DNA ligase-1
MHSFADLYTALDETTKTSVKTAALVRYFAQADPADAAWAIWFLSGRKLKQIVSAAKLTSLACELAGVSAWLFDECKHSVGDLPETIALLLPAPTSQSTRSLRSWVEDILQPLKQAPESQQRNVLTEAWACLEPRERFLFNKLLTGSFRVGVSHQLLVRGLAEISGLDTAIIAHRLMGDWKPTPAFYDALIHPDDTNEDHTRPYPFFLATPIEDTPEVLGDVADWQVEWKWDGIRAQLIRRKGELFLWSRGEELITERFPEFANIVESLPEGTVIDGEILPWRDGKVLPFAKLQQRIGRKDLTPKILREVPVILLAYDLLQYQGEDLRERPLSERRSLLATLTDDFHLAAQVQLSPTLEANSWEKLGQLRAGSRERLVEGLMLKRKSSSYRTGRVRGDWWKWKIEPLTIDAVLVYAQKGSGKRASLFTDYTFAIWVDGELQPFAKAYSGLTDDEIKLVDNFIRKNTVEKFGPVHSIKAELVFELAFEGIQRSSRHKSGIAVRFPRILRWRSDKKPADADTLDRVRALLPPEEAKPAKKTKAPKPEPKFVQMELFS